MNISPHGCWEGTEGLPHRHDPALADALAEFTKGQCVVDLGCGPGDYVRALLAAGVHCDGFDGNPQTPEVSRGLCRHADLTGPHEFSPPWDTVLCLEVLEHIPMEYEALAVLRVCRAARSCIIVSWAHPGQGGAGHFNCRDQDYVRARFAEHGFTVNEPATAALRERATLSWFRSNLLVLEKQETIA